MKQKHYHYKVHFTDGKVKNYSYCSEIIAESFTDKNNLFIYEEVDFDDLSSVKIFEDYKYCGELKAIINMDKVEYIEVNVTVSDDEDDEDDTSNKDSKDEVVNAPFKPGDMVMSIDKRTSPLYLKVISIDNELTFTGQVLFSKSDWITSGYFISCFEKVDEIILTNNQFKAGDFVMPKVFNKGLPTRIKMVKSIESPNVFIGQRSEDEDDLHPYMSDYYIKISLPLSAEYACDIKGQELAKSVCGFKVGDTVINKDRTILSVEGSIIVDSIDYSTLSFTGHESEKGEDTTGMHFILDYELLDSQFIGE